VRERLTRYWPFLVLALLPLLPLWRSVLLGQTLGPWDQIRHFAPYGGPAPDKGWDVLQADACLQFYGWRDLVFKAWGSGHLPIWNHYQLGGAPLLANSQSGAFYPLHILVGLLHLPTGPAITLLAWFHLAWAGIGAFLLARRLGASDVGALVAGGGFALSGFLVSWTALASVPTTCAWIPWCLWAAAGLGQPDVKPLRAAAALAASVAMMLLGGHLQFAAYGVVAIVGVLVVRAVQAGWRAPLVGLGALIFGGLLSYPQLGPVLANGRLSHRQNVPTWQGFHDYNVGAIQPFELLSLPDPTLLGLPTETVQIADQPFTGYWPAFVQRGASFAETAIGLGPFVLAALALGLSRRSLQGGVAPIVVATLGLLLALGTIVGALLFFLVPGWSATASPGRASVLFVLGGAVLAGLGFAIADEQQTARQATRRLLIFAAILLFAAGGVSQFPLQSWLPNLPADVLAATRPTAVALLLRVLLGCGVGALLFLALRSAKPRQGALVTAALVLAGIPSLFLIPTGDPNLPKLETSAQRVAFINKPWDLLNAPAATAPPNLAALSGVHDLAGYDSLISRTVKNRLTEIDGQDPAPAANGNILFVKDTFDAKKLADAGVSEVWSRHALAQLPEVTPSQDGLYHYPLPGPGRASVNGQPATIAAEAADRLEVDAQGPGLFVLRDNIDFQTWNLAVDGKPADFTAEPWPALNLTPGTHHLVFTPAGTPVFGLIGLLAGLLGLAVVAASPQNLRKMGTNESNAS
jgi:hypothetical protein